MSGGHFLGRGRIPKSVAAVRGTVDRELYLGRVKDILSDGVFLYGINWDSKGRKEKCPVDTF